MTDQPNSTNGGAPSEQPGVPALTTEQWRERCVSLLASDDVALVLTARAVFAFSSAAHEEMSTLDTRCAEPACDMCVLVRLDRARMFRRLVVTFLKHLHLECQTQIERESDDALLAYAVMFWIRDCRQSRVSGVKVRLPDPELCIPEMFYK